MWQQIVRSIAVIIVTAAVLGRANEAYSEPTTKVPSMPLTFTENLGQWDECVHFRANAGGATMWITGDGVHYQFVRQTPVTELLVINAIFVGADPDPCIEARESTAYKCNYFLENDRNRWRTNVPNYRTIVFDDIYDGIDLKYYSTGAQMEYDFVVSPGADIGRIAVKYNGIESMSIDEAGNMCVETVWGTVREQAPVAYQSIDDTRIPVEVAFLLVDDRTFGFEIGPEYDPTMPLVIDPILLFGTYLGHSGDEEGHAVAMDGNRNIYVTGYTTSIGFPTQSPIHGPRDMKDAFITKFDRWGGLVYSTFLGGNGDDRARGIAVDELGYAYVTGVTGSAYFPTVNPYKDGPLTCNVDAFVSKLAPGGDALVFSTYLGGDDVDWGLDIAVDDAGYVYVAGMTQSSDFPTVSPYQTFQGVRDACVTKFHTTGDSLIYSTCIGGSAIDNTWDMALGSDGSVYVTGETQSIDYPVFNAYQTDQGNQDVFLTRLNAAGDDVIYSTYLGGGLMDVGMGVDVDPAGCAYVTGWTQSFDFPIENQYQTNMSYDDVFVTKFSAAGDDVLYSTYLGGNSYELGADIKVDADGNAYVAGWTRSSDFPTIDPIQTHQDTIDLFLAKLNPAGNGLLFGTYLGGDGVDWAWGLTLDFLGNPCITGYTNSTDLPLQYEYQTYQGAKDVFVMLLSEANVSVEELPAPYHLVLHQNVPNPFNPVTMIQYDVPAGGAWVSIAIYDVEGRLIRTLVKGEQTAGSKTVMWDGRDDGGNTAASGVYFCKMSAPGFEKTKKMVLLK